MLLKQQQPLALAFALSRDTTNLTKKIERLRKEEHLSKKPFFYSSLNQIRREIFMGLDMWLYEKERNSEEVSEIGYWRKANQIRAFFASYALELIGENIEMLAVNKEMLLELKRRINCCLTERNENISSELLPTSQGFFFGSSEYDEWYYQDLEATLPIIEEALTAINNNNLVFYGEWW